MSGTEQNSTIVAPKKDIQSIPNQCVVASQAKHQSIIICTSKSEDFYTQIAPTIPSILFSFLAVILSIWSLIYTYLKDKKSRRNSIEDDFWIRKVLSPSSIEKLLTFTTSIISELAHQSLAGSLSKKIHNKFGQDSLFQIRAISCGFWNLSLVNKELSLNVASELELYEDCLANFYGKVVSHNLNKMLPPPPSVSEVTANLNEIQYRIFNLIKDYQLNS